MNIWPWSRFRELERHIEILKEANRLISEALQIELMSKQPELMDRTFGYERTGKKPD